MKSYKTILILISILLILTTFLPITLENPIAISISQESCYDNPLTQHGKLSKENKKNIVSNPSDIIELDQSQTQGENQFQLYNGNWAAQSFKPSLDVLSRVSIFINLTDNEESISKPEINKLDNQITTMIQNHIQDTCKRKYSIMDTLIDSLIATLSPKTIHINDETHNLTVSIRKELHGEDIVLISKNISMSIDEQYWIDWDLPDIIVEPSQTYYIILHTKGGNENYFYNWFYNDGGSDSNVYKNGTAFYSSNSGNTWQSLDDGHDDFIFKTYGYVSYLAPEEGDGITEYWVLIAADGQGEQDLNSYAENLADDLQNKLMVFGWDPNHITLLVNDDVASGFQNAVAWMDEMDDGDDLCIYYGFGQNNTIHVNNWLHQLDRLGAKGLGIIIDSSYSGKIINEYGKSGRVILTSCHALEPSFYQPGYGFGIFSYYFLRSLHPLRDINEDGWISLEESFDYVYTRVWMEGFYDQRPQLYDDFPGEFNFIEI